MSLTKRTTAVQWLYQELENQIEINENLRELFKQAQEYEREIIEDAYMANRRNLEEDEAATYYLTNYFY